MNLDANGYKLIEDNEGFVPHAYQDEGGVWTIGYGTTWHDDRWVMQGDTCTKEEADAWFRWYADQSADKVDFELKSGGIVNFPQPCFNALVDTAYNIGIGGLLGSTLLKVILTNPADPAIFDYKMLGMHGVPHSCRFLDWVYVKHEVSDNLVKRRIRAANMYKQGIL